MICRDRPWADGSQPCCEHRRGTLVWCCWCGMAYRVVLEKSHGKYRKNPTRTELARTKKRG